MWEKKREENFHQTKKNIARFEKKAHTRASRDSSSYYVYDFLRRIILNNAVRRRSNTRPQVSALLGYRSLNRRTLHFPLRVDDDARVVLKVNHQTFLSLERSSLANHNRREHFLSQIWFTFFHSAHKHGTDVRRWQTVLATAPTFDRDDVQVLGPSVVSAVHNRADWASVRHSVFSARSGSSSCKDSSEERKCKRQHTSNCYASLSRTR